MQPLSTSRQTYLDWLRIFAIAGVLFFHCARPFMEDDPWHVNNATQSGLLSEFAFWLSRFRMHLLFFISGTISWYMVKRKSAAGFVGLRFRRLFIPLLVGMFIIVPPQIYFERVQHGYQGSFWSWYPNTFDFQPYPKGNFSWHHLWFIAYLLVYDILLAPFFAWATSPKAAKFVEKLGYFAKGKRVYWFIAPSAIWFSALILQYPDTNDLIHDPCFFVYWMLFLLAGFLFVLQPALMDSLERNRRTSLAFAFLMIVTINVFRWNDIEIDTLWGGENWKSHPLTYLYLARMPLNSWLWVFALVGYGKRYFNKQHRLLPYLNQAIYPFYILHQTVIVVFAFYVVQTNDTIDMKYLFLVISTFLFCMIAYHVFIRPFNVMRFLFGMKPKSAITPLPPIEKPQPATSQVN
ncbi:peptidoglycan/LPS O-acetylase OafA/YrhL [Chitinophaga skermanii]|uniref:Peptidoglycan/LPS O-acetylase OafA/YrhL n=1 Tax=Chitinophaga skermanii TaxID=331697 RepID=A0A327QHG0_9BACT|nr:acyltransferase family protein [Chitinophaga skermanii]RAJ04046.1 peptidoglycan/LPS O-acetylase OafA/YrhL [Chitinophaga skermanii]